MTVAYRSLSWHSRVKHNSAICPKGTNGLATVCFSTEEIPGADRVARWRDHHASVALNVEIEPAQDHLFEACEVSRILPALHLMSLTMSAARLIRTRVTDGNDEFSLLVNRTGHLTVSGRGREVPLAPGDGVLIRSDDVMVCDRLSYGESLSLRVPRPILSSIVVGVDDRHAPDLGAVGDPEASDVLCRDADRRKRSCRALPSRPGRQSCARFDRAGARQDARCRGGGERGRAAGSAVTRSEGLHCRKQFPARPFGRRHRRPSGGHAALSSKVV